MLTTEITNEAFMSLLEVKLNANYTEEQKELINAFGKGPTFCFADPGTGKTFTAIGGLITAELMKGIPGNSIYAISFTKLATGELAVRHERACRSVGISKQVNFHTLHSLCRNIIKENFRKFGMTKFDTSGALPMESAFSLIEGSCREQNIGIAPSQIKAVINACRKLNASLIFDRDIVETKMAFKECKIDYETFDFIRGTLFAYSFLSENISISDLLLYTVMFLTRYPEVSEAFKKQCKLMIIDEAQDLSLLQLRIISLLTDNPVLIGDMKQQIYGFNGACQEVVEEFHKLYPNAVDLKLTKSFRCKNNIAEYATKLILPNNVGGEDFTGVGEGGSVTLLNGLYENGANIVGLVDKLKEDFISNSNRFTRDYLFLVRNNISITPIIEELYKKGLPFRVNKYQPAYDIPVMKELYELLQLCEQPTNYNNILALRYLIPEFKSYYVLQEHPLFKVCKSTGCSIFEVNYQFKNIPVASAAMELLCEVSELVKKGESVRVLIGKLYDMYYENWLTYNTWKLENNPKYYLSSVDSLLDKNFVKFTQDETRKLNIIEESERFGRGIRCYTMHASKGLEADVVYIIDADEGILPNVAMLQKMLDKKCDMDVARQIREERSLCYVACTRAKDELYIVHNGKPSPIILGNNPYKQFDDIYSYYKSTGNDIVAFDSFTRRYLPN